MFTHKDSTPMIRYVKPCKFSSVSKSTIGERLGAGTLRNRDR